LKISSVLIEISLRTHLRRFIDQL